MKRCPRCSQVYTDDLSFCLSDGTSLLAIDDGPDESTVIRPRSGKSEGGTGLWFKVLAAAFALFLGFVILAAIAIWIFWRPGPIFVPGNGNYPSTPTPTPARTPTPVPTATRRSGIVDTESEKLEQERKRLEDERHTESEKLDQERKRLEDERRRLEDEKRKEPPVFKDPGVTRITFRRGSIGETVGGTVGRQRDFVLRTVAGQYLSATVRSPGGCVTFADGGSSTGYPTRSADSHLSLRNNCGEPAKFTLSVTVR